MKVGWIKIKLKSWFELCGFRCCVRACAGVFVCVREERERRERGSSIYWNKAGSKYNFTSAMFGYCGFEKVTTRGCFEESKEVIKGIFGELVNNVVTPSQRFDYDV